MHIIRSEDTTRFDSLESLPNIIERYQAIHPAVLNAETRPERGEMFCCRHLQMLLQGTASHPLASPSCAGVQTFSSLFPQLRSSGAAIVYSGVLLLWWNSTAQPCPVSCPSYVCMVLSFLCFRSALMFRKRLMVPGQRLQS